MTDSAGTVSVEPARLDSSVSTAGPKESRVASWRPARDVLLVMLGALLALGAEEWRDSRQRSARVTAALEGIATELRANRTKAAAARAHHRRLVDTLGALARRRSLPDSSIYLYGMFNPASVSSTAWQVARETGALGDMPLNIVLGLAPVYETQERYHSLGDAINIGIMSDVRRDGMDVVLRDRFTQFIPLAIDFSNREAALLERYEKAIALLDERR